MIDTLGDEQKRITSCQCGLTGGCQLCNPFIKPINYARLFDPSYGHEQLQKWIDDNAKNALPIEKFKEVREKVANKMTEEEINLASKMLIYSVFVSDQEVKNMKIQELIAKLRYFFPKKFWTKQRRELLD